MAERIKEMGPATRATGDTLRQADVAWASGWGPSGSEAPFILANESTGQAAVVLETLDLAVVVGPLPPIKGPSGVALLHAAAKPRLERTLVEDPFFRSRSPSQAGGPTRPGGSVGLGWAIPLRFSDAGWANGPADVVYWALEWNVWGGRRSGLIFG